MSCVDEAVRRSGLMTTVTATDGKGRMMDRPEETETSMSARTALDGEVTREMDVDVAQGQSVGMSDGQGSR